MKNLLGLLLAMLVFVSCNHDQKIAYINTATIYEKFQLKNELESKLNKVVEARKQLLDSLLLNLQLADKNTEGKQANEEAISKVELLRQQYLMKKQEFEEDNQALVKKYDGQIWEQLNQYIKDYGDKEDYRYIFGATGGGNLMYAKEDDDITDELIKYVNERYQGKEK